MLFICIVTNCKCYKSYTFLSRSRNSNSPSKVSLEKGVNEYSKEDVLNPFLDDKPAIPKRYDTCKMLVSGVIGTTPVETYLKDGHYIVRFSLGIVGHFVANHIGEYQKPAETMWILCEIWDQEAKDSFQKLKKGAKCNIIGTLISSKWIDKSNGEERKQFRIRILKIITDEMMDQFSSSFNDDVQ